MKKMPVARASEAVEIKPDPGHEVRERKYRAEDALRTIEQAEKCKSDKGLMRDVKSLAKEKIKHLGKIK